MPVTPPNSGPGPNPDPGRPTNPTLDVYWPGTIPTLIPSINWCSLKVVGPNANDGQDGGQVAGSSVAG